MLSVYADCRCDPRIALERSPGSQYRLVYHQQGSLIRQHAPEA
jgi:YD repeat-containing protein